MQLIDTDTDIGIQTKMSTMQPESLEKFSLIENVRSGITAITNVNEECVKNQEVVQACQKNTDGGDLDAQHTITGQEPILNETRDEKEFPENKESSEIKDSDNLRIEINSKMQEKSNVEIAHSSMIDDDDNGTPEKKVNTTDNLAISTTYNNETLYTTDRENAKNNEVEQDQQNNRLFVDRIEVPDKMNNDITENKNKKQNEEDTQMFGEDIQQQKTTSKMNNCLKKEPIDQEVKQKGEDNNIEKIYEDVEMGVTCEKPGEVISNSTDVSIKVVNKIGEVINKESEKLDELRENSIIYDMIIEKNKNIEMDVIFDEDELMVNSNTIEETIEKHNDLDTMMDVTCDEDNDGNESLSKTKIEDEIQDNSVIDKNVEKQNEEVIEMNISCEKQDKSMSEDAIQEVKDEELLSREELKEKVIHNNENECVKNDNIEKHSEGEIDFTCEKKVERIRSVPELTIKETKDCDRGLTMVSGKDAIMEVKAIELQNHVNKCVEKEAINKDVTRRDEGNQNKMVFTEQYEVNYSVTEDKVEEDSRGYRKIKDKIEEQLSDKIVNKDVLEQQKIIVVQNSVKADLMEEQVKDNCAIDDNENQNVKVDETTTKYEQNYNTNDSVTKDNIEEQGKDSKVTKINNDKSDNDVLEVPKEIDKREQLEEHIEITKQVSNNSEMKVKITEIIKENKDVQQGLKEIEKTTNETSCEIDDQAEKDNMEENKIIEPHNENSALDQKLQKISVQDEEESLEENKIIKQIQKCSNVTNQMDVKQSPQISKTNDNIAEQDAPSSNPCNIKHVNAEHVESKDSLIDSNLKNLTSSSSNEIAKNNEGFEKNHEANESVDKHESCKNILNDSNEGTEKVVEDSETLSKLLNCDENYSTITFISTSETGDTEMESDEIIDIADEKDDDKAQLMGDVENEPKIIEDIAISKSKSVSTLITKPSGDNFSGDQAANIFVQDTSVQQLDLKKTQTENVEEKKKLTHISKLSNTLDILSDEEQDLPKYASKNDVPECVEKQQCTSINIEDDDEIVLIDDEPKSKNDKNKTESLPESESENYLMDESLITGDNDEESTEIFEGRKDAIQTDVSLQTEVPISNAAVIKTGEPEICAEATVQEETVQEETVQKKPLIQLNFLKSSLKNLADLTRDELEEFCILKIVESVVDRSNLSEIKSQLKTVTQNIEEYKKKASILVKQNRDLQVVIKSVQEEQKKKSTMPITPLKITRSVGMQVLMTDKTAVRKKIQSPNQNNAASSRQGKAAQNPTRLQKMLISNTPPIPVPRLVPAVNNSNSNNVKTQSTNVNTSGKSQVAGQPTNTPIQTVSNGLPVTTPAQKPEKRPHSRMQQSNSFTVDLTDDEPPSKVVLRNVTPPVRLVPPQNLLAPNRQPFGASMSNPRKVYIPISGSQTPVGVRPGQAIMLKTISTPGPRQRVPTPSTIKPNTVRMQRVPCRHPAPLPDYVKQYQPLNWKALPPAPVLKLSKVDNGIVISWKIEDFIEDDHEEIASYQLYAYQETSSPPSTTLWKKIGDVKALPLPMACTLTQFMAGFKYYFAVRAVDVRSRLGPFSAPGSILLLNTT